MSGLSTEVANMLYCSGNKNLCVYSKLEQPPPPPPSFNSDLAQWVMDDFSKSLKYFITHGPLPLAAKVTYSSLNPSTFLCLCLRNRYKHFTEHLLNSKMLARSFLTITIFFQISAAQNNLAIGLWTCKGHFCSQAENSHEDEGKRKNNSKTKN